MLANCPGIFNCSGLSGSDQEGFVDLLKSYVWPCYLPLFPEYHHRTGLPFFDPPCRGDHPTTPPTKHMTGRLPSCELGESQPRPCFHSCFTRCARSPAPPSFVLKLRLCPMPTTASRPCPWTGMSMSGALVSPPLGGGVGSGKSEKRAGALGL